MRVCRGIGAVVLAFVLACTTEVEVPMEQSEFPTASTTAAKCDEGAGARPLDFSDYWNCRDIIWVDVSALPTSPDLRGSASSAVAEWNSALNAQNLELPVLTVTGGGHTYRIGVTLPSTGSQFCGQVLVSTRPNAINMAAGSCGAFRDVFLHELSHVYGFSNKWHTRGTAGVSDHCARYLPAGKATNTGVCQHEVESLHRHSGIRAAADVSLSKHIMTGFAGLPAAISLETGETSNLGVTGFVFRRVHPAFCAFGECDPIAPTGNGSWGESSPAISLSGSAQFTRTVTALAAGAGTVTVSPLTTTYALAGYFTGDATRVTVTAPPPPPAPTGLAASNITPISATVSWTAGDPTATTVLRYRMTGQTAWTSANGGNALPAGQTSFALTGLHCATSYDVSVHHVNGTTAGPALVLTLFSTSACQTGTSVNPPTAFSQTGCTPSTVGGKQYATYDLGWTAGSNPSAAIYHIGSAFSNNSGSAAIIRTGRIIQTTDDVGPYLVTSTASPRYFWVRHVNGGQASAWVALQGNPIQIKDGCLL
jgi:hypothetical protein